MDICTGIENGWNHVDHLDVFYSLVFEKGGFNFALGKFESKKPDVSQKTSMCDIKKQSSS